MSRTKEWRLWLIGWLVYPFIVLASPGGNAEYQEARYALRRWLHAWPNRDLRLEAHRLTAKPPEGWSA